MNADALTYTQVKAAFEHLIHSYERHDLAGVLSVIAPDADVIIYGAGAHDKRAGKAAIKHHIEQDWAQVNALTFRVDCLSISNADGVAWLAADGTLEAQIADQSVRCLFRMTCVFEQRGAAWLLVQSHVSTPIEGEPFVEYT